MKKGLHILQEKFGYLPIPEKGRYVNDPAVTDVNGVLYVPPKQERNYLPLIITGVGIIAVITAIFLLKKQKTKRGVAL